MTLKSHALNMLQWDENDITLTGLQMNEFCLKTLYGVQTLWCVTCVPKHLLAKFYFPVTSFLCLRLGHLYYLIAMISNSFHLHWDCPIPIGH